MKRDVTIRIAAEAARHHGVITRGQAAAVGAGSSFVDRKVKSATWVRAAPGVFLVAGSPATWERAVAVAVYGAGESSTVRPILTPRTARRSKASR